MPKHTETGAKGEKEAEKFLLKKGYQIFHRNWCFERKEIDLIAEKDGFLVFVEVKTRSGFDFGYPEEAVTPQKELYLKAAADAFSEENPQFKKLRFDIISVIIQNGMVKEIKHFKDAFF